MNRIYSEPVKKPKKKAAEEIKAGESDLPPRPIAFANANRAISMSQQAAIQKENSGNQELRDKIAKLEKENEQLKAKPTVKKENKGQDKEIAGLKKKLETAEAKNSDLSEKLTQSKAELRASKKNEESLERKCNALETSEKELKIANSMLTKSVKALNKATGTEKAAEADEQLLQKLRKTNEKLVQDAESMKRSNEELEDGLCDALAEISCLKEKLQIMAAAQEIRESVVQPAPVVQSVPSQSGIEVTWFAKTCLQSKAFTSKRYTVRTNAYLDTFILRPSEEGVDCISGILNIPGMELCGYYGEIKLSARYSEDGESIIITV